MFRLLNRSMKGNSDFISLLINVGWQPVAFLAMLYDKWSKREER